jgi:hypothetical protein
MAMNGDYNKITSDLSRAHVRYASVSITLAEDVIDWSLRENTTLFDRMNVGREIVLRNTSPVFVRLNSTTNDVIELFEYEGLNMVGYPVEDIFISGATGSIIRVILIGWN